ncbi:tyrosine-type recombinase/integrase [Dinoroseobacter shibae]
MLTQEKHLPMPKVKLSKKLVESAAAGDGDEVFWDTALPGFGLRVKSSGSKSYVVQYRNRQTGRSRRKTIGQHGPLMTLYQAREIARGYLADALRGGDPVMEAQARRKAKSMRDLADDYMTNHALPKKRPRSAAMDRSLLDRVVLPAFGRQSVDEVSHKDIQRLHNSLRDTPYQANRVLALLSKMFELAIRWGLRGDNPVKGVPRFAEEKRYRWLSDNELDRLREALDAHPNQRAANAIRLQLLTGARTGEVLTSQWSDFDLDRGVWVKPSHHTKQKRTEHLPLSAATVALLRSIAHGRTDDSPFVFPGRKPGHPIKDLKRFWTSVTSTAGLKDYRLHDNRHTHASHLVSSGHSLPIVGRLLGHTNPMTTQRYAHLADDPLRQAAEVMGQKLTNTEKK